MAFCSKCGKEVADGAAYCSSCGEQLQTVSTQAEESQSVPTQSEDMNNEADRASAGLLFLSFCIPIIGLILYLVWKNDSPKKASACGGRALVGFSFAIFLYVLVTTGVIK